jgi:hypothetical protein
MARTDGHDLAAFGGRIGVHDLPTSRSVGAAGEHPARPLTSFTPEQRRLLLALIEAGRGTLSPRTAPRMPEDVEGRAPR